MKVTGPGEYRMRDGEKAVVKFRMPDEYQGQYPWVGYLQHRGRAFQDCTWFKVCIWSDTGKSASVNCDIIGPWRDVKYVGLFVDAELGAMRVSKLYETIEQLLDSERQRPTTILKRIKCGNETRWEIVGNNDG